MGHLANPAAKLLQFLVREKLIAALDEELVDPCMQVHFLDPKIVVGLDKNLGDDEAGLLAVN